MIEVDLITIIFIYNTSLFSGAIAFLYLLIHSLETTGLKQLAIAYALLGVGSIIAGLGEFSIFPLFLWANLSFLMGIVAYSLFFAGFVSLNRDRNKMVFRVMGILLVSEIIVALFTDLWHVDRIRATSFHLVAAVSLFYSGINVLRKKRFEKLNARWLLSISLMIGGLAFFFTMLALIFQEVYFAIVALNFSFQIFINFLVTIFTYALVKERVEKQLQAISLIDPLTKVGNRRWLEANKPVQMRQKDSILMIDLDHFKDVNDSYGHQMGDMALFRVAEKIESILRKNSLFARYGGEEFIAFIPNVSKNIVLNIGERIRKEVEQMEFSHSPQDFKLTVSIGICWNNGSFKSFEEMTKISDEALYAAKNTGRNKVVQKG